MKFILPFLLFAAAAFPQATSQITIVPKQDDSATGVIKFREKYANGQNSVNLRAPSTLAGSYNLTLPSALPVASGYCLGIDTSGNLTSQSCTNAVVAQDYAWTQYFENISAGSRTLTFTPCPFNASDTTWVIRFTDGSQTEYLAPTGGTCTQGAATGTGTFTFVNSYSDLAALSASGGTQEAINSVSDGSTVSVRVKNGSLPVGSDILTNGRYVSVVCDGPGALFYPISNNIAIFNASGPGGIRVFGCALNNILSKTGITGILTYNPTGDSYGTVVSDVSITGMQYGIHLGTAYAANVYNSALYNHSVAALWIEQVQTGDAGIGCICGNIFSDSIGGTYGLLWNGPGNLKVMENSFNGYIEQIHLEPTMGTVTVSGTSVTWMSGNKFRSIWATGYGFVAENTVASTVASVTDDEHLTLSSPQPGCLNCSYYVGNTSQLQIMNNTLDSGTLTTYNIRAVGGVPFYNFQINNNFTSNPSQTAHKAISLEAEGFYFGSVQANNIQTSVTGTTIGIYVKYGNYINVMNNQIVNQLTGVKIDSLAVGVKTGQNNCTNTAATTNCVLSASASTVLHELNPVTYAQLISLTAANSSYVYCSDCRIGISTNLCTSGGTGSPVYWINGGRTCMAYGSVPPVYSGGNFVNTVLEIGTIDAYGLAFKTNNTTRFTLQPGSGTLLYATDGGGDIGAGGANRPDNVYVKTLTNSGKFGTASNCSDGTATPADCGSAAAGSVIISAAATSVVVNTTAVSANSQILVLFDSSLGTKLGVTCNTTYAAPYVTARSGGTSFTITVAAAPAANPACFSYQILN